MLPFYNFFTQVNINNILMIEFYKNYVLVSQILSALVQLKEID